MRKAELSVGGHHHNLRALLAAVSADKLAAATARLDRGESATQIANALGVSRATIYRHAAVVTAPDQI